MDGNTGAGIVTVTITTMIFRFGFGFPLFLGLGYGLGTRYYNDDVDCIGRWHRHSSGRLHCHGQLVWD